MRPELLSRCPHRLRRPQERIGVRERIRRLRREGHDISAATVGRLIRDMVAHVPMAPVSTFVRVSRRQRRTHRPHAVRISGPLMTRRPGQAVQVAPFPTHEKSRFRTGFNPVLALGCFIKHSTA